MVRLLTLFLSILMAAIAARPSEAASYATGAPPGVYNPKEDYDEDRVPDQLDFSKYAKCRCCEAEPRGCPEPEEHAPPAPPHPGVSARGRAKPCYDVWEGDAICDDSDQVCPLSESP